MPEMPPLEAAAASVDITPPLEVGLLMSAAEHRWAPFEGVRRPLLARVLVLRQGPCTVVLTAYDLIGIAGEAFGGLEEFKRRIIAASGLPIGIDHLVLTCTHTHSAPETIALTDLYREPPFAAWAGTLIQRTADAITTAAAGLQPCSMTAGSARLPGHCVHRRIRTTRGVLLNHPPVPEEIVLSREGPVGDTVQVLAFRGGDGRLIATLVNATCHPVHEMCIPRIAPDFPGELCAAPEAAHPGGVALFMNGAAGNINPPTVSGGADDARRHGALLADCAGEILARMNPPGTRTTHAAALGKLSTAPRGPGGGMGLARRAPALPARTETGPPAAEPIIAPVAVLRLGHVAMVFLPGEPFVELGLTIRRRSPFAQTLVVGYAEDYIGYVPTDQAFAEGGYETQAGRWSRLLPGSAERVVEAAMEALEELRAGDGPTTSPAG